MPLTSDTLVNLISGLGTVRDKSTGNAFALTILDKMALDAAYRGDWIARKIVDVPAFDETREWRDWQAEKPQIELLEQEETRHGVQRKVAQARKLSRLYGGSVIFIGDGTADPMAPLAPDQVKKGGLKYLNVFSRHEMVAGELDQDPLSPFYGEPVKYSLAGAGRMVDIHPSRVVRFIGAEIPDRVLAFDGWGDSVLQAVNDAVMHASSASATVAALLQEAKVDVIKVPGFMESLGAADFRNRIIERYSLANLGKSITNSLLMDAEEEWDHKQISFAQLPEVLNTYLQIASGAADIPATRLLGQTPGGLQSTGQSDTRNYYDRIGAGQNLDLRPALSRLDEVLIRSALGSRPPEVHYIWAPLWQMTEVEKADVFSKKTKGVKELHDTGLVPDQALARGVQNMLIEDGTFPGLDAALDEFGDEPEAKDAEAEAQRLQAEQQQIAADAKPRSLYVSRKLLNGVEFLSWAKGQGFTTTLDADDLHVTIMYSRTAVDWMKVGSPWGGDDKGRMTIAPGGARIVEPLGDKGAVVLLFNSSELAWRHMAMREAGAESDYPDYQPHVTITYQPGEVDLDKVEPYRGKLVFGPEIFAEIDEDWASKVAGGTRTGDAPFLGDAFDPNQPRGPDGRWVTVGQAVAIGLQRSSRPVRADLGEVHRADEISSLAGIDVTGFRHMLGSQAVSHILRNHGAGSGEARRGQIEVTEADFSKLRSILKEPAAISRASQSGKHGEPRIEVSKTIDGVRFTYVAEVQRRKKRLDAVTMWKR